MDVMKSFSKVLLIVLAVFLAACSSGNDPDNTTIPEVPDGLVGYWIGSNFFYINQADTTERVDLAEFGVVFSIIVNPDSSYSSTTLFLGQTIEEEGTISISQDILTFTQPSDQVRIGKFTLDGTAMDIRFEEEAFDFNQDGIDDPAILDITMEKQTR